MCPSFHHFICLLLFVTILITVVSKVPKPVGLILFLFYSVILFLWSLVISWFSVLSTQLKQICRVDSTKRLYGKLCLKKVTPSIRIHHCTEYVIIATWIFSYFSCATIIKTKTILSRRIKKKIIWIKILKMKKHKTGRDRNCRTLQTEKTSWCSLSWYTGKKGFVRGFGGFTVADSYFFLLVGRDGGGEV